MTYISIGLSACKDDVIPLQLISCWSPLYFKTHLMFYKGSFCCPFSNVCPCNALISACFSVLYAECCVLAEASWEHREKRKDDQGQIKVEKKNERRHFLQYEIESFSRQGRFSAALTFCIEL